MNPNATLLRSGQLAVSMGVDPKTIWNWTVDGTIPANAVVRVGRSRHARYKRAVLEAAGLLTKPVAVAP